jgi:hypothetical protein
MTTDCLGWKERQLPKRCINVCETHSRTQLSELSVLFTQDKCFMLLAIYYYRDQFKKSEMGRECGMNATGEK